MLEKYETSAHRRRENKNCEAAQTVRVFPDRIMTVILSLAQAAAHGEAA
jgi:hypothetical protein